MISISPWFERKFRFDLESRYFPLVLERLYGTAPRLHQLLAGLSGPTLHRRSDDGWSIQEHVGHLVDLEPLWYGRVEDVLAGAKVMRPADLQNRATDEADHNERPIGEILQAFAELRGRLTTKLSRLSLDDVARTAEHPRLRQPMRIVDLAVFVAEHDDHHLATIRERLARDLGFGI